MRATVVLVALLITAYASAVGAASLTVMIDKLNEAAAKCGISEPQLESVARRAVEKRRLRSDAEPRGWLSVRVTVTLVGRNRCTARVSVHMKASAEPLPSGGIANPKKRSRVPAIVLCDKNGGHSGPKAAFSSKVGSLVEYSIKQCLGSLRY